jgi:hypothetical protein
MTLADFIQSKGTHDITLLKENLEKDFRVVKALWDDNLNQVKQQHAEEIDQAVTMEINFKKFQTVKDQKFTEGYTLQNELDTLYTDLIPDILTSSFVNNLIHQALKDIPQETVFSLSGEYATQLEILIQKAGYATKMSKKESLSLGKATATISSGHIEITVEELLSLIKEKTLPLVMQHI